MRIIYGKEIKTKKLLKLKVKVLKRLMVRAKHIDEYLHASDSLRVAIDKYEKFLN
jgi:hypothetical protein